MDVSGRIAQSRHFSVGCVNLNRGVCGREFILSTSGSTMNRSGNRCWRRSMMHFSVIMQRAVGEIGIHKTPKAPQIELQTERLCEQLEIARRWEKPIIFHVVRTKRY